jgi:tetratricopeptide (TPR) repeat protein/predicted Ser/Thr protein kinase
MDQGGWDHAAELFGRLLAGEDIDEVLRIERDAEIRECVRRLWSHHKDATEEDYLGGGVEFQLTPLFRPGQILLNRFRIEKMLGSGGMGEVYLAFDSGMEELVALKTVARLLAPSPAVRRRFLAEVQNARRVTHRNICRIHELFDDGETVFFTMEYIEGRLLSDIDPKSIPVAFAREIVGQLAEGLRAAHSRHIVHGDFKPSNIILTSEQPSRAVIMDFGLARAMERTPAPGGNLSFEVTAGRYTAPELRSGSPPSFHADIFALGKVAAELIPGDSVLQRCTDPDPAARPSLDAVIRHLQPNSNRRVWMIAAGVGAAGLAGYALSPVNRRGIEAVLPTGARLLLNAFRALAGANDQTRFARAVTLTALQQSPRLHAISDQDALTALRRIAPKESLSVYSTKPLSGSLLAKVLEQVRAGFWVESDLSHTGGRYSLALRVLRVSDGRLVTEGGIHDLPSIALLARQAATWLRRIAGESEHSLAVNSADVPSYTSNNPEALDLYYRAAEYTATARSADAIPLLEQAIRLDPAFAQAHNVLGMAFRPLGFYDRSFQELEAAMRLAARLPERERNLIETNYYSLTNDPVNMVNCARRNRDYFPDEPRAYRYLASVLAWSGAPADAVPFNRKALELAPDEDLLRLQLIDNLAESGDFEQALREYRAAQTRGIRNTWLHHGGGLALMGLERYREAQGAFESEFKDITNAPDVMGPHIMRGDVDLAIVRMTEQRFRTEGSGNAGGPDQIRYRHQADEFLCGLNFMADRREAAVGYLRRMADLPRYPTLARQLHCTAFWAARLSEGRVLEDCHSALAEIARRWPNAFSEATEKHAAALMAWRGNQTESARTAFVDSLGKFRSVFTLFDAAEFFASQRLHDVAQEYWKGFEEKRGTVIEFWFPGMLILGWLYRARSAHNAMDHKTARQHAQKVLDHWGDSQPRLEAVRAARSIAAANAF